MSPAASNSSAAESRGNRTVRMPATPVGELGRPTEAGLRRWLGLLDQPDRLVDLELEGVLRRAGRLPAGSSPITVGKAGAEYLQELIERLRAPGQASLKERLPYLVLSSCFVKRTKSWQVANQLGLSQRQITRERSRAVRLLLAELADRSTPSASPQRIPVIADYMPRPAVTTALARAVEIRHLLSVHGPKGIGKTSLLADYAASAVAEGEPVLWYRFRIGVNDTLLALLFDLADLLAACNQPELSELLAEPARPPGLPVLTRQALRDLGRLSNLVLVADDFQLVEHDPAVAGFLDEVESRHEHVRVITIGRQSHAPAGSASFEVPPFTSAETAALLDRLGCSVSADLAGRIHDWTKGVAHLISLAGSWLKTSTDQEVSQVFGSLSKLDEVQDYLLDCITELMGAVDRSILEAASVFRDRFTDEALAHVSGNTRGTVADASRYFVRFHVATRGRDGDVAFFHASVRDYIYARLDDARRQELHRRAADFYERVGNIDEATYHEQMAEPHGSQGSPGPPGPPGKRRAAGGKRAVAGGAG